MADDIGRRAFLWLAGGIGGIGIGVTTQGVENVSGNTYPYPQYQEGVEELLDRLQQRYDHTVRVTESADHREVITEAAPDSNRSLRKQYTQNPSSLDRKAEEAVVAMHTPLQEYDDHPGYPDAVDTYRFRAVSGSGTVSYHIDSDIETADIPQNDVFARALSLEDRQTLEESKESRWEGLFRFGPYY